MPRWTEETRRKQREMIMKSKPWRKSTGPKTPEGKEKSAQNAFKHGMRTRKYDDLKHALWMQQCYLCEVKNQYKMFLAKKRLDTLMSRENPPENEILRVLEEICAQSSPVEDRPLN